MKVNTDPTAMMRVARQVASDYSRDPNIEGALVRHPMPDDPDFPTTCDVELALVTRKGVDPWKEGYSLARKISHDVLVDICAIDIEMLQSNLTNPTSWILSLGDPRAFQVLFDFSGELAELFSKFKARYLLNAPKRFPLWLQECKGHLLVAMNTKMRMVPRLSEAAFALAYMVCGLLDLRECTFAGAFLKLPRKLQLISPEIESEFREYFPAQEKDPFKAAQQLSTLAQELASVYPSSSLLTPEDKGVMEYNLNPTEFEYRAFVTQEIAKKDKTTALWYIRAWSTFLFGSHAHAMNRTYHRYEPPDKPYATWIEILGAPNVTSVELFISWVDELFQSITVAN